MIGWGRPPLCHIILSQKEEKKSEFLKFGWIDGSISFIRLTTDEWDPLIRPNLKFTFFFFYFLGQYFLIWELSAC